METNTGNALKGADVPPRLAWSLDEVATAISVSTGYVRKVIAAGELNATRAGRRVLVLDSDLRAWLDRNRG